MRWQHRHSAFTVHQLPALRDNYIYLIQPHGRKLCIVIDPAEAAVVSAACRDLDLTPAFIINTHHHWDHTDGNRALKRAFGCKIIGHAPDAERIPAIDLRVPTESPLSVLGLEMRLLDVPGHTLGHMAIVLDDALFPGDTLFGAGCGRIFEGTYEQMWHSLSRLAALPGDSKIYCAHEYTLANLRFAARIDRDNPVLNARTKQAKALRKEGRPTIPSTIQLERETNPFLRPLDPVFRQAYARQHQVADNPLAVFRDIRARKDRA
ncbi:MAG: hydroxyacylglutathione hydrolase [Zetaproteobacteria bacterium]|nr:MAG: hydroxyacylglutathione hydrolase [Zetaproteobacteria bacterium]